MTPKEIELDLKNKLSKERYLHILGVETSAVALAINYAYNITAAKIAGLLHDCAKWMSPEEMLSYCKNNHIFV